MGINGTVSTNRLISNLLPKLLQGIGKTCQDRPDLIIASWSEVIGERLSPMTTALSFEDGVLYVKVKNSTLYSLLHTHEKKRLLKSLQEKWPQSNIKNIVFRIG